MKRIISLIIFAALQLGCLAQVNPKLESLYAYLKANGLVKGYTLSNQHEEGLRKEYSFEFMLYEEEPSPFLEDYFKTPLKAKADSVKRAEQPKLREAFKQVRRTLSELTEDAVESYSYEYHQGGHDTITTVIVLKNFTEGPIPKFLRYPNITHMDGFKIPEMVHFNYRGYKYPGSYSVSPLGQGRLEVNAIVDTALYATQDFDVMTLHKTILPLLKDKTIKRHTIHCQHDSTFDVFPANDVTFSNATLRCQKTKRARGDNNLTVYKFTSEDKAKTVLHQIMECVRQHVAEHPREAYTIYSDEYFPPQNVETMFKCGTYEYEYNLERPRTSMTIDTTMDEEGFYILINVYEDDEVLPSEWKTLKEMVNGKKTYYRADDGWK